MSTTVISSTVSTHKSGRQRHVNRVVGGAEQSKLAKCAVCRSLVYLVFSFSVPVCLPLSTSLSLPLYQEEVRQAESGIENQTDNLRDEREKERGRTNKGRKFLIENWRKRATNTSLASLYCLRASILAGLTSLGGIMEEGFDSRPTTLSLIAWHICTGF